MSPVTTYVLQTLLGLALLGLVGVALVLGARRIGVGAHGGPLSLVGRLPLDARRAVYLVRVGEVIYVVGASEAGLTKLGELEGARVPESPTVPPRDVLPVLRRFLAKPDARG